MKTSIWYVVWNWIKAHKTFVIVFAVILLCAIWLSIREAVIRHQDRKIQKLQDSILVLDVKRQNLDKELERLNEQYAYLNVINQQMQAELKNREKELSDLKKKHKREIDSLLNIPPDTVYKKLIAHYPNYDSGDLRFSFSASQIIPIYRTTVSYGFLQDEYNLQSNALTTCKNLNTGYEKSIGNLESQVGNLKENIKLADEQIGNYKKEVTTLSGRIEKKSFWVRVWQVAALTAAGIAILSK